MSDEFLSRSGATVLRIALGVMYVTHGVLLKVLMYGLAGTVEYFESLGLPGWFAHATIAAETIGGALLILDIRTRWVSLGLLPVLAGATWAHSSNGWVFSNAGGGWEYPVFLIIVSIAVALQAPAKVPAQVPRQANRQLTAGLR